MTDKDLNRPSCFADIEVVFPVGSDGLRHPPDTCMACEQRTECLMKAMKRKGGLQVQEEMVTRAYASRRIGFWQRWSKIKYLRQQQKKKAKPF